MKKIFLLLLSAICLNAYAQRKKDHKNFTPMVVKSIGVTFQEFETLNNRIIGGFSDYNALKDHIWTISLGSMNVMQNFISVVNVTGGSSLSGDRDKKSSDIRILSADLDLGYDVLPADRIMLFPLIGIGAETYHAIFRRDNSNVDFDDVLEFPAVQNGIRSVKFTNSFITYRAGLGVAFKSARHPGFIGIKAGYVGSFKDNKAWKSSEYQDLENSPQDNVSRFHVSLIFGGMPKMR